MIHFSSDSCCLQYLCDNWTATHTIGPACLRTAYRNVSMLREKCRGERQSEGKVGSRDERSSINKKNRVVNNTCTKWRFNIIVTVLLSYASVLSIIIPASKPHGYLCKKSSRRRQRVRERTRARVTGATRTGRRMVFLRLDQIPK